MKEKIEKKLNEIIDYIISKNPADITYNEYRILDNCLNHIKYDEEQKEKSKKMIEAMTSALTFPSVPSSLPESNEN